VTSDPRFDRLWGAGIDGLFRRSDGDVRPKVVVPWPTWTRQRGRAPYDLDVVRTALRGVPRLADIDPRSLTATQTWVRWDGVDHYLRPTYRETGRTFADRHSVINRFPFVYRRPDGTHLVLAGHHRSAAALVRAEPVRAIVVDEPGGDGPSLRPDTDRSGTGEGAITPSLLLAAPGSPGRTGMLVAEARATIGSGGVAVVDDALVAAAVLGPLGVDPEEAAWMIGRALRGLGPTGSSESEG